MDYNEQFAIEANNFYNVAGKSVLVVGCAYGKDCTYFVKFGASTVFGIDVNEAIGRDFVHERVTYFCMSAEKMDFPDDYFDLTYSVATMEHVPHIEPAFSEMVRVTKPGGAIYCVATPLWNSREGHHKADVFDPNKYPWIHLRFTKDEIIEKCRQGEIDYPAEITDINLHIEYIFNPLHFNFESAQKYLDACNKLGNIEIIRNEIGCESNEILTEELKQELFAKGYNELELLGLGHTFAAIKKPNESSQKAELETTLNLQNEGQQAQALTESLQLIKEQQELLQGLREEFQMKYAQLESLVHQLQQTSNQQLLLKDKQIAKLQKQLDKKEADLRKCSDQMREIEAIVQAMKSSKFWKVRSYWLRLKHNLGIQTNEIVN